VNTIHITVQAYNAEQTIGRAIDSILAQTYKNFVIYVCDDASTDSTPEIMRDYEKRGLIKAYFNDINGVYSESGNEFLDVKNYISNDDFYAQLDADDELYPQFFEKLINFAIQNNLDIAQTGCDVIELDTKNKKTLKVFYETKEPLFFETKEDYRNGFDTLFSSSYTIWGKLFRGNVSGRMIYTLANFGIGHDTASVLNAQTKAKRIGFLPERLSVYYVNNENSISAKYNEKRKYEPEAMFSLVENLLLEKLELTLPDEFTLISCYRIYFGFINDLFNVHLKMDIPIDLKISEIIYVLGCEHCRDFYRRFDYFRMCSDKLYKFDGLLLPIQWILANRDEISFIQLSEFYNLFFDIIYCSKEPKFTKAEIDFLLKIDISFANLLIKGDFENAALWLQKVPKSITEFGVSQKIKLLTAQNMS
jgi:glycosyltransferase involved in cell wall biosynthesis